MPTPSSPHTPMLAERENFFHHQTYLVAGPTPLSPPVIAHHQKSQLLAGYSAPSLHLGIVARCYLVGIVCLITERQQTTVVVLYLLHVSRFQGAIW